jgi:signal peptidase
MGAGKNVPEVRTFNSGGGKREPMSADDGPRPPDDRGDDGRGSTGPLRRILTATDGPLLIVRETVLSVSAVAVIGLLLFTVSGVWPPMVAVESGSMEPHMHKGDLVFITETGRFAPDAAHEGTGVVTQDVGRETGHWKFGAHGSVIVYDDPGDTGPPVIHRAQFWVEEGENWYDQADPEHVSADDCAEMRNCPAPNAGFVTKGDANEERDRGTVSHDRVIGKVVFVIPFIGHLIQFANTQTGFLALVLTPIALFVISELWEMAKSVRGSETSTDAETGDDRATTAVRADADEGGGGFALTRSSLQLLLLLFGLYVPYSVYIAYTTREAWSIAVATGTVVGFLFCFVLYLASDGSNGTSTVGRSVDGIVRRGELPATVSDRRTVALEAVEELVQMAIDRDDWVRYDEDYGTYFLTRDDTLYLHHAEPETDGGTAVDEAAAGAETAADDADDHPLTVTDGPETNTDRSSAADRDADGAPEEGGDET